MARETTKLKERTSPVVAKSKKVEEEKEIVESEEEEGEVSVSEEGGEEEEEGEEEETEPEPESVEEPVESVTPKKTTTLEKRTSPVGAMGGQSKVTEEEEPKKGVRRIDLRQKGAVGTENVANVPINKPLKITLSKNRGGMRSGKQPLKITGTFVKPKSKVEAVELVENVESETREETEVPTIQQQKRKMTIKSDRRYAIAKHYQGKGTMWKQTEEQEKRWLTDLREHLRQLLNTLVEKYDKNNKINRLDLLTDDDAMEVWKIVFTHQTYDFEQAKNYEVPERLGDNLLGAAFSEYLYLTLPPEIITPSSLTLFKNYYMSKAEQPKLADKLGLPKLVRLGPYKGLEDKTREDVFEAFFGGINIIASRKLGFGVGYLLTFYFINSLFEDITINSNILLGDAITQVKEIFDALGWHTDKSKQVPYHQEKTKDGQITFEVHLSQPAIEFFKNFDKTANVILGMATRPTKDQAEMEANVKALAYLNELGVNAESIEEIKAYRDSTNPLFANEYKKALEKANLQNYKQIRFSKQGTSYGRNIIYLIGESDDGKDAIISAVLSDSKKFDEGKRLVLQEYLKS